MPECSNPLVPCAMTGAVTCLAGFDGITVVIHGSSGCYYYPATLLRAPLAGTFLNEQDVIFGSEERLREVLGGIPKSGQRIAVVTSCVTAILGEDIRAMFSSPDIVLVDSPGFIGSFEKGYKKALEVLAPGIESGASGVNIDGISLMDPFCRGNVRELTRLLALAGLAPGTVLCLDSLQKIGSCSPYTITADGDLASGIGANLGCVLGLDAVRSTFRRIGDAIGGSDPSPVLKEADTEEERLIQACDKFLRRFDPPHAAVFAGHSYAGFAADALKKYLDAEIVCIGSRTEIVGRHGHGFPCLYTPGSRDIRELIRKHDPDLVVGSSFEREVAGPVAFVGITPPLRDRVRLATKPLAGTSGTLLFMEDVINACIDHQAR